MFFVQLLINFLISTR